MSRHRNIRTIDVDEEYDGYYSCYGHSVEDDFCISPQTEAQFLYDRGAQKTSMHAFIEENSVPEDYEEDSFSNSDKEELKPNLSQLDAAKLQTCVEAMENVVGDTISEEVLRNAAMQHNFDLEKALNAVLSEKTAPKPQRIKKTVLVRDNNVKNSSESTIPLVYGRKSESEGKKEALNENVMQLKKSENVVPVTQEESSSKSAQQYTVEEQVVSSKSAKLGKFDAEQIYKKERGQGKSLINLIIIGHVDAGKSTLMGHLLYRLGQVSKKAMHKFEQDSKKLGKSSFMYAWVLDETDEERTRGITMDVAQSKFETEHRSVVLLDAPGHKDFIPNMITGAAQADVAILVVDSTCGEFETGFEAGGQTREHTMLIRSLGVSQIAVAVNKMDNVNWSEERYKEIQGKMSAFLKQVGFKESDVTFVPCSGLSGENLICSPQALDLKKWYTGPTLINAIDNFEPPERAVTKPLRMCVSDVFKGTSGGFCVSGKIEAGVVKSGDKVLVMPAGEQAIIKAITTDDSAVQHSFAGDHIIMQITGVDINNVSTGSVICDIERPVKVTSVFEARLVIFNITVPITKGFPVILHYQSFCEQAIIKNLLAHLSRSSGEVLKRKPRCLTKNSSATVEIEVSRPICVEIFKDFKELGRFMLRCNGCTVAAGLITALK